MKRKLPSHRRASPAAPSPPASAPPDCSPGPRRSTSCAPQGAAQGRRAAAALRRIRPASARTASAASISPAGILKELGLPPLQIMNADTETNVDVARSRAEKLIGEGAQLLVGAFDSGQSTAIAQVAEQKGIPFVINIAAAPPITEQGYKFVFRNFPTAAHDPARRLPQPEGSVRGRRRRRRRRRCSCTSTTPSAPRCRRASAR